MNELKQIATDIENFVDAALHSVIRLSEALYELKSNLAFYARGDGNGCAEGAGACPEARPGEAAPADKQGGARTPVQAAMDDRGNECAEGVQREEAARPPVKAKPEHVKASSHPRDLPLPDVTTAIKATGGSDSVVLTEYYRLFDAVCYSENLARISQKGKRYLAHCAGYITVRETGPDGVRAVRLVRPN